MLLADLGLTRGAFVSEIRIPKSGGHRKSKLSKRTGGER